MKDGSTEIMVILDRTGSMESIKEDVMGGFNAFLDRQRTGEGTAGITLVQFDSQDPFEVVYSDRDIREAPYLTHETYVPRASTPLLDALGRGMTYLDQKLDKRGPDNQPENVLFVVVTDGLENASREFTRDLVFKMIAERRARGWEFVFLSADEAAIQEAHTLGFAPDASMRFALGEAAVTAAFHSLSEATLRRRRRERGVSFFSREERLAQEEINKEEESKP